MSILHLRVQGGLCNRLRTIASGLKWRNAAGADELVIHWNLDREMNARFTDFFEVPEGLAFRERDHEPFLEHLLFSPRLRKIIRTWHSDYENWLSAADFSWVRLTDEMTNRVAAIRGQLPARCVGVHIRRTDNVESIRRSPIEAFYREMDAAIANGAEGFFLASDNDLVKQDLRARYGAEKIFTCADVAERSSKNGVRDAVVDLMLLASTTRIIGSCYSSFTDVAAAIGGVELTCAM